MEHCLSESLKRTRVDYFDFYLLHGVNASTSDRFSTSNLEKTRNSEHGNFLIGRRQRERRSLGRKMNGI